MKNTFDESISAESAPAVKKVESGPGRGVSRLFDHGGPTQLLSHQGVAKVFVSSQINSINPLCLH